jgi:tRNA pseudouridine38-40 synthase
MKRYFFKISYKGTSFFGWQKQSSEISVQETIEENISKVQSHKDVSIVGCGRTDTGVHAKEYFFHWDDKDGIDIEQMQYKLNKMLPESISVHDIFNVKIDQHARFSATQRTYRYFIHKEKDPFLIEKSWHIAQALDLKKMNDAAQLSIGEKDFSSFAKTNTDVKHHICQLQDAQWFQKENGLIFEVRANRFLRNMVRAIVGTCVDVGLNKLTLQEFEKIITDKDRQKASGSAPAQGLFLWNVDY